MTAHVLHPNLTVHHHMHFPEQRRMPDSRGCQCMLHSQRGLPCSSGLLRVRLVLKLGWRGFRCASVIFSVGCHGNGVGRRERRGLGSLGILTPIWVACLVMPLSHKDKVKSYIN